MIQQKFIPAHIWNIYWYCKIPVASNDLQPISVPIFYIIFTGKENYKQKNGSQVQRPKLNKVNIGKMDERGLPKRTAPDS